MHRLTNKYPTEGLIQVVFVCTLRGTHGLKERFAGLFALCAVIVPLIRSEDAFL